MAKKQDQGGPIELSRMIAAVRWELAQAEQQGRDQDVRFRVEEVELELAVTLEHTETVGAGVKVWVIEAGADDTKRVARAHKMKVKLTPQRGPGPEGKGDKMLVTSDGSSPASGGDSMPLGGD